MSFADAITACFKKYAEFRGELHDPSSGGFALLYYIVILVPVVPLVVGAPDSFPSGNGPAFAFGLILAGVVLAMVIPYLAVGVRRLHDTGKSGAWWFIGLVPFGWVVLLVFFASDGDLGWNRYGPPSGIQSAPAPSPGLLPPPPPPPSGL